jgi:hypothetical protein
MCVILISSFSLPNVHRTTYKSLIPNLLIEKNILQSDRVPPNLKVSSFCIPTLLSYKNTVKVIFIINPAPPYFNILEVPNIQNLRDLGLSSYNSLTAGVGVTG